jgi:hypothetical protein
MRIRVLTEVLHPPPSQQRRSNGCLLLLGGLVRLPFQHIP